MKRFHSGSPEPVASSPSHTSAQPSDADATCRSDCQNVPTDARPVGDHRHQLAGGGLGQEVSLAAAAAGDARVRRSRPPARDRSRPALRGRTCGNGSAGDQVMPSALSSRVPSVDPATNRSPAQVSSVRSPVAPVDAGDQVRPSSLSSAAPSSPTATSRLPSVASLRRLPRSSEGPRRTRRRSSPSRRSPTTTNCPPAQTTSRAQLRRPWGCRARFRRLPTDRPQARRSWWRTPPRPGGPCDAADAVPCRTSRGASTRLVPSRPSFDPRTESATPTATQRIAGPRTSITGGPRVPDPVPVEAVDADEDVEPEA